MLKTPSYTNMAFVYIKSNYGSKTGLKKGCMNVCFYCKFNILTVKKANWLPDLISLVVTL